MDGLLDKISSYNIFNYLLPGSLFAVIGDVVTDYRFVQEDIVVGLFLYYFVGLVVSRIGSLVVEPILKAVGFVTFVDYRKFVEASKADAKIEVLSETNNMYRTLCALFLLLLFVVLFDQFAPALPWLVDGCCSARNLDADRRGKALISFDSEGSNEDAEQQTNQAV